MRFARRAMPRISPTERVALESGTSGLERLVFSGALTQRDLRPYRPRELTPTDLKMMGRIPALIRSVDESEVLRRRVTPPEHPFWAHARREGFFGLIVPPEYGGNRMSVTGLSRALQRMASCSSSVPVHVMVPASLGPAELLVHYGTPEQKARWLPKLADGAIPCFGLTSAAAGSDAAGSMVDRGVVTEEAGRVAIRLECEKRYITLAPVADVVGLAFKISDPEDILGRVYGRSCDGAISLALVERGAPRLSLDGYTDPLGLGFANGFVQADGVEIAVDDVIGGVEGLGQGWKYLMEALAAGRGVALPAGAAGSAKMLTNAVGGYASLRQQFRIPISQFEGVGEKLAAMALRTLEVDSLVKLMNCALERGERPPVMSAVLKQRTTELSRAVALDAMDVVAGSAICMGEQNFVAPAYLSAPVGITVEGSNTMTRSMLIFGQGVVRSHPQLLGLIRALETDDHRAFSDGLIACVSANAALLAAPVARATELERFVRFFALSSSCSLALGGELKRRECLSGRYADMLSYILAGFAVEWRLGLLPPEARPGSALGEAFAQANLHRLQSTAQALVDNHPHAPLHRALYRLKVGSFGRHCAPDDSALLAVSKELCEAGTPLRALFDEDVLFLHPNVARIREAMREPTPELLTEIFRVDAFVCEGGRLARPDGGGARSGADAAGFPHPAP